MYITFQSADNKSAIEEIEKATGAKVVSAEFLLGKDNNHLFKPNEKQSSSVYRIIHNSTER